jgi:hypothetical protein
MARKREDPLYMRINRQPVLYELARAVSYGGRKSGELRDVMAGMAKKYGSGPVALAFSELTMTDTATMLTVLRPEVRKVCRQIMGPPPEDPYYSTYWEGRTPPASHKPPVDQPAIQEQQKDTPTPAEQRMTPEPQTPSPPAQQSAAQVTAPCTRWRYDPSDAALEAFERLEGWLRGAPAQRGSHHPDNAPFVVALLEALAA